MKGQPARRARGVIAAASLKRRQPRQHGLQKIRARGVIAAASLKRACSGQPLSNPRSARGVIAAASLKLGDRRRIYLADARQLARFDVLIGGGVAAGELTSIS